MSKDYKRYQRILTYQMQSEKRDEVEAAKKRYFELHGRPASMSMVISESSGSTAYPNN